MSSASPPPGIAVWSPHFLPWESRFFQVSPRGKRTFHLRNASPPRGTRTAPAASGTRVLCKWRHRQRGHRASSLGNTEPHPREH